MTPSTHRFRVAFVLALLASLALPLSAFASEESEAAPAQEKKEKSAVSVEMRLDASSDDSATLPNVNVSIDLDALKKEGALIVAEGQTVREIVQYGQDAVIVGRVERDVVVFGGNVSVAPTGSIGGGLVVFGGNAVVAGAVEGDMVVFGGNASLSGSLAGDMVAFGGNVELNDDARVRGDIVSLGGHITGKDVASVAGKVVEFSPGAWLAKKAKEAAFGAILSLWFSPAMLLYRAVLLVFWVAVALLLTLMFAPAVSRGAEHVRTRWGRALLVGVLWTAFAWTLLIVFGLLSLVLVGLPFLFILVVFWIAVKFFGMTLVFRAMGAKVASWLGTPDASAYYAVFLGACFLGLLRFVPVVGGLVWCIAGLLGAGAALASRFGNRGVNDAKPVTVSVAVDPPPAAAAE